MTDLKILTISITSIAGDNWQPINILNHYFYMKMCHCISLNGPAL